MTEKEGKLKKKRYATVEKINNENNSGQYKLNTNLMNEEVVRLKE